MPTLPLLATLYSMGKTRLLSVSASLFVKNLEIIVKKFLCTPIVILVCIFWHLPISQYFLNFIHRESPNLIPIFFSIKNFQFAARVQGLLKGPGSFWVFNAQICILPHSRLFFSHFWHLFQHQKLIKIEHYIVLQSIWDILIYYTYYLIFMKKLCFD